MSKQARRAFVGALYFVLGVVCFTLGVPALINTHDTIISALGWVLAGASALMGLYGFYAITVAVVQDITSRSTTKE